jgi:two-component system cell cycle response regulator DivK
MKIFKSNTPQGRKILIIDDDAGVVTMLRLYLQKACKDTVIEAASGNEGLAQAQAAMPDLIIIELALTEPDGYEISKRLKAIPSLRHIPILLIGAPQNIFPGVHAPAVQGYLAKPFGPDELGKARNELLKGKTYWSSTSLWPHFD